MSDYCITQKDPYRSKRDTPRWHEASFQTIQVFMERKRFPILDVLGTHTVTVTVQNWLHLYLCYSMRGFFLSNKLKWFHYKKVACV